jgi:hypothetical protein
MRDGSYAIDFRLLGADLRRFQFIRDQLRACPEPRITFTVNLQQACQELIEAKIEAIFEGEDWQIDYYFTSLNGDYVCILTCIHSCASDDCNNLEYFVTQRTAWGEVGGRRHRREVRLTKKRRMLLTALSRTFETRRLTRLVIAMYQKRIVSHETTCYRYQITRQICRTGIMLPTE